MFKQEIESAFGGMGAPVPGHHPDLQALFRRIFPRLRPFIDAQRELAWEYLDHAGLLAGKLAVCDIGYRGSMQAAMARVATLRGTQADYTGYYFATFDTKLWPYLGTYGWICEDGKPEPSYAALNQSIPLLELLFTAQHGTVLGYERDAQGVATPVLEQAAPEEQERFRISEQVHTGALRFIQAAIEHDLLDAVDTDAAFNLAGWNALVCTPTRPLLRLLSTPSHNEGVGASSFVPLLTRVRFWQALLRPRATALAMRRCPWRVGALAAMSWPTRQLVTRVLEPNWRLRHRLRNNPMARLWRARLNAPDSAIIGARSSPELRSLPGPPSTTDRIRLPRSPGRQPGQQQHHAKHNRAQQRNRGQQQATPHDIGAANGGRVRPLACSANAIAPVASAGRQMFRTRSRACSPVWRNVMIR